MLHALREGTPNRKQIALAMVKDMLDESSFEASPGHVIPTGLGHAAEHLVDRMARGAEDGD